MRAVVLGLFVVVLVAIALSWWRRPAAEFRGSRDSTSRSTAATEKGSPSTFRPTSSRASPSSPSRQPIGGDSQAEWGTRRRHPARDPRRGRGQRARQAGRHQERRLPDRGRRRRRGARDRRQGRVGQARPRAAAARRRRGHGRRRQDLDERDPPQARRARAGRRRHDQGQRQRGHDHREGATCATVCISRGFPAGREAGAISSRCGQPASPRVLSLPPPAPGQPGRLVPVGRGGVCPCPERAEADLSLDRLLHLPLVPRHGARVLRERRDAPTRSTATSSRSRWTARSGRTWTTCTCRPSRR